MFTAGLVSHRRIALVVCLLLGSGGFAARAQFEFPTGLSGLDNSASNYDVAIEARYTAAEGDRPAQLSITARVPEGFHVYAIDQGTLPNDGGGPMATAITLSPDSSVRLIGPWKPSEPPRSHVDQEVWTGLELREHSGEVTWTAPVELVSSAENPAIRGMVTGQACNPHTCIPFEQSFSVALGPEAVLLGSPPTSPVLESPQAFGDDGPVGNATTAYDLSQITLEETEDQSFVYYLITAFLGGLILNIMPCVLPVIGLKVMSFVQQAGQSRAQALALNCWYAAGIVAVFLILASLAVTLQLGWGGQFSSAKFNIALIGIVFAMALSLLGLWEIPIPGFVGGGVAMKAAEREGPSAALLKGVLTTLLATPCIGPFMTPALFWAVKQPAWMTYSVFGVLGLGMASPYLLIGAFPELVRFLPRPGAWMESFKKIMGLVLLATVVWLMTFIDAPLAVPTVLMLVGIATACWWVSQTPITARGSQKFYAWTTAGLLVVIAALGSYGWLYQGVMLPRFEKAVAAYAQQQIALQRLEIARSLRQIEQLDQLDQVIEVLDEGDVDLPWQPFSLDKLGRLTLGQRRTVLVDFTADWCLTCKTLEKFVLKTPEVEEALTQADVVTMEADYTKYPPTLDRAIKALGGVGVPLVAIFPAAHPYRPKVFADGNYSKAELIAAISQATGRDDTLPISNNAKQTSLTKASESDPLR
jgi:thiol:disulfide interchange protein DsbD